MTALHENQYVTLTFVVRTPAGERPGDDPRTLLTDDEVVFWGSEDGIAEHALGLGADPSSWHDESDDVTARPTTFCGCGHELVWVGGHWEHNIAPYIWGDDHDPDEPAPEGPAREYWDREDGVTE